VVQTPSTAPPGKHLRLLQALRHCMFDPYLGTSAMLPPCRPVAEPVQTRRAKRGGMLRCHPPAHPKITWWFSVFNVRLFTKVRWTGEPTYLHNAALTFIAKCTRLYT
jgi:hypothetical protein